MQFHNACSTISSWLDRMWTNMKYRACEQTWNIEFKHRWVKVREKRRNHKKWEKESKNKGRRKRKRWGAKERQKNSHPGYCWPQELLQGCPGQMISELQPTGPTVPDPSHHWSPTTSSTTCTRTSPGRQDTAGVVQQYGSSLHTDGRPASLPLSDPSGQPVWAEFDSSQLKKKRNKLTIDSSYRTAMYQ